MISEEKIILIIFLILFIFIRSINFIQHLNFSSDQGHFSLKALEIYQNRTLTLIGPPTSFNFEGRQIFQGSIIYYFLLLFLILGNFDPVKSSFFFMLFSAISLIPLYYGTNFLINKRAALVITVLFTLLPYYINYTRFLWNPNFQFVLFPYAILTLGLYRKTNKSLYIVIAGFLLGVILQFHYQFILIIFGVIIFLAYKYKLKLSKFLYLCLGIFLGLLPIILFEFRNNFYNLQTLYFFIENSPKFFNQNPTNETSHYFLTLSFFIFLVFSSLFQKLLKPKVIIIFFASLLLTDLFLYLPKPESGFRMPHRWNYPSEQLVANIIESKKLDNFNVTNLIYDTRANVQKYLLVKNGLNINYENYQANEYLFVIGNDQLLQDSKAFELTNFRCKKILKTWKINEKYNLYLLKRCTKPTPLKS